MSQPSIIPLPRPIQPQRPKIVVEHDEIDNRRPSMFWDEETPAADNYTKLGQLLAERGDLFRLAGDEGGIVVIRRDGTTKAISTAADLAPLIVDRMDLSIYLGDKPKGTKLSNAHLAAMLRTEAFLSCFRTVDGVTRVPLFLPDFSTTDPGYSDAGLGHRYFHAGKQAELSSSLRQPRAIQAKTPSLPSLRG